MRRATTLGANALEDDLETVVVSRVQTTQVQELDETFFGLNHEDIGDSNARLLHATNDHTAPIQRIAMTLERRHWSENQLDVAIAGDDIVDQQANRLGLLAELEIDA